MNKKNDNKYGFKHFYFFQRITPDLILELGRKNPVASTVYLLLLHCSNNVGCCSVSQPNIAKFIHKSVRTVTRAINYLAYNHYVAIAHNGRANVYILNFNQVWGTYNYKKPIVMKQVKFPTNVVIKNDSKNKEFFSELNSFVNHHVNKMVDLGKTQIKTIKPNKYYIDRAKKEKAKAHANAKKKAMADKLSKSLHNLEKLYGQVKGMERANHLEGRWIRLISSKYDKQKQHQKSKGAVKQLP